MDGAHTGPSIGRGKLRVRLAQRKEMGTVVLVDTLAQRPCL